MDAKTQNGNTGKKNVFLIINQQITPLTKDVTRLGRQLDNDVVFKEESISRNHAEIRFENGKYFLYDCLSTSGTFVNSRRIECCVLNSGDLVSLANIQFMFVNNNPRIASNSAIATRSLPPDNLPKPNGK
jgi:pSer/pThr/pTyr-binding forkhead associated (FHA) protein